MGGGARVGGHGQVRLAEAGVRPQAAVAGVAGGERLSPGRVRWGALSIKSWSKWDLQYTDMWVRGSAGATC